MQKNDCLTLRAENLGAEMEGVCRYEGMPVFVPGLLPGEEATVRIVKAEKRYAFGRMESPPAVASPDRRPVDCPAYPRCGGCTARHMTYEATLAAKRQQVADCLQRIGGISAEVSPVLGMEEPSRYRNKTSLPAGGTADQPVLGFYAPRSHAVIPASAYDFEAEAPAYQRLRSGSYGMTVFWMQKTLEQLGYFKDTTATGYFGPMTASALKRFQKASGLSQDGVLGQKTYDKLVAAQKEKQTKAATAGT